MEEEFKMFCKRCGKRLERNIDAEFQDGQAYCKECFNVLEYNWKKRDAKEILDNRSGEGKEQKSLW